MGIDAVIQDENCNRISEIVSDPHSIVPDCLPGPDDSTYSCVRFIDPYGDTVFNTLQARAMTAEWDKLKLAFAARGAEKLWADVRELIVRCSEEPHTYLRFIGD